MQGNLKTHGRPLDNRLFTTGKANPRPINPTRDSARARPHCLTEAHTPTIDIFTS